MPIRQIKESDHPEWRRMRRALWPGCAESMQLLEMKSYSAQRGTSTVVVFTREGGGLGGFVEIAIRPRVDGSQSAKVGYVEGWYVDPDLRGRGIGRQLIEAAEQWAIKQGVTELASDAELDDAPALLVHKALGFRETFRLVHFLKPLKKSEAR